MPEKTGRGPHADQEKDRARREQKAEEAEQQFHEPSNLADAHKSRRSCSQ
jgi:hypothetical protein